MIQHREKIVKQIWKEKDLSKAEEILKVFEIQANKDGRMRIHEIW